jgi:hypothetical protein
MTSKNKSGVKGLCWHKATQKWRGVIFANRTAHNIGYWSTIEEAIEPMKQARERLHKEFANHN